MKVSLSWLKEYVSIELEPEALADALTMAGLEVEAMWDRYAYLENIRVCRVLDVQPHPNADKLTCCTVDAGSGPISVVCGAPNVRKDMLAALALPGAELPNGMEIKKSKIRGETSEGMLCSAGELALDEDGSGIMSLPEEAVVGTPLHQALNLSDMVFEIGLTPNRPDCTSIIGIAREVAAIQKTSLQLPKIPEESADGHVSDLTSVTIDAPDLCPRYAAKMIENVTIGPSPAWLKDRLLSVGLRPINNIVDVTNFVMLETGQPLHAFDFSFLEEGRIVVRTAQGGEPFTTLDGKARTLSEEMLLICDGKKPVAIAGVMGGENSEIQETSTTVLIESAYFNPATVRKTAKQLGLSTDASFRFERGIDPCGTINSLLRAARLMVEVAGGAPVDGIIDAHPKPSQAIKIPLSVSATNRLLGIDLSRDTIVDLLESINIAFDPDADPADPESMVFIIPSNRVDLQRPEDLMEEVARRYGYDNIPTTLPVMAAADRSRKNATPKDLRESCRDKMTGFGFFEAVNYSFISRESADKLLLAEKDERRRALAILNPLSEEQAVMRTSLLPGLLETTAKNLSKQIKNLRLFEVGKVFFDQGGGQLPEEREMIAGVWTGSRAADAWNSPSTPCDFYDIKGVVSELLEGLDLKGSSYTRDGAADGPYLRPGHGAGISIGATPLGLAGEIHPKVIAAYGLKQPVFAFELMLDRIITLLPDRKRVSGISKFPSVSRDVTLIVDKALEAQRILDQFQQMEATLVEGVHLFDVFEGGAITDGKKSVSFRIIYRSSEKTLDDDTVNRIHTKLCDRIINNFKADLP
jgi:phenylalanyl-tRNA synthetase beta chain